MSLYAHGNVYDTCLRILRAKGYELSLKGGYTPDGEYDPAELIWCAEKNGIRFGGHSPVELLGLAAVYEFKGEPIDASDYWWVVEGPEVWDELQARLPSYEEQEAEYNALEWVPVDDGTAPKG
jgi:hypothetical protein